MAEKAPFMSRPVYTLRQSAHCARLYDSNGDFVSRQEFVFGIDAEYAIRDAALWARSIGRNGILYAVAFEYFIR